MTLTSTNKLKILYHSDMHFNTEDDIEVFVLSLPPETNYDIVIFAGDITNGNISLIQKLISRINKPVYFVCGNHDYYNRNITEVHKFLLDAGLNLLKEGVSYTHNHNGIDYTIVGATLWTTFLLDGRKARHAARKAAFASIADFHCITYNTSLLSLDLMEYLSLKDWNWLAKFKHKPNTIVVTHFPCSSVTQHERYDGDVMNPYFRSNKITTGFDIIFSGHTHDCFDVVDKFNCRHLLNPLGYKREFYKMISSFDNSIVGVNGYNSHKIVEY